MRIIRLFISVCVSVTLLTTGLLLSQRAIGARGVENTTSTEALVPVAVDVWEVGAVAVASDTRLMYPCCNNTVQSYGQFPLGELPPREFASAPITATVLSARILYYMELAEGDATLDLAVCDDSDNVVRELTLAPITFVSQQAHKWLDIALTDDFADRTISPNEFLCYRGILTDEGNVNIEMAIQAVVQYMDTPTSVVWIPTVNGE